MRSLNTCRSLEKSGEKRNRHCFWNKQERTLSTDRTHRPAALSYSNLSVSKGLSSWSLNELFTVPDVPTQCRMQFYVILALTSSTHWRALQSAPIPPSELCTIRTPIRCREPIPTQREGSVIPENGWIFTSHSPQKQPLRVWYNF